MRVPIEPRPGDECDSWVVGEPLRNYARVSDVRVHALRQSFYALNEVKRRLWAERWPDVAQLFAAQFREKSVLTEVVPPANAAVRIDRFGHRWEFSVAPVERAGLNNDAAKRCAVAA